jgi:hypothetical protein
MRTLLPFLLLLAAQVAAQDLQLSVIYTCNGDRLYLESCNIRDLSDTSTCMVAHPDRPKHNGFMAYTTETRGALKKLLPTCQQPSADEVARAKAHYKRQNDIQAANEKKANDENDAIEARAQAVITGKKPLTPEERAINRCITSGRLPASCTGNALLGAFGQMLSQVLPAAGGDGPAPGPVVAGVYNGAGNWRLDFTAEGVLVSCSFLSPDERHYTSDFKNNRLVLNIDTSPKPLVLTLMRDLTMSAPGPITINGVVAVASSGGGYRNKAGTPISDAEAASNREPVYDSQGLRVYNPGPQTSFSPRTANCPALRVSSNVGAVGAQTMQMDVLKTMFGGDKGPPMPPGIRMRGIFAAPSGFSAQFFPESVILGCGPDVARAYPYSVVADGTKTFIKIDAPDHPLAVAFRPDGSLDPGTGPYQVHGRTILGQTDDGDFRFAPLEQTCNLGVLTHSKAIPSSGGIPATSVAGDAGGRLSTATAPLGNATLALTSGFPTQPGVPNPLAGHPYVLLRDSYANDLSKAGISVPPGMSPYKYVGTVCTARTPECQKILEALNANAISAARADVNGGATLPGVPPGTYYLMISARYNNQSLIWGQPVQLKPGPNSLKLDQTNATPMN